MSISVDSNGASNRVTTGKAVALTDDSIFHFHNFQCSLPLLHLTRLNIIDQHVTRYAILSLELQELTLPASFIPPSPTGGVLPYWMLLISSAAFYNVAQSYVVLWQTKEIYGKKPEQGTFGLTYGLYSYITGPRIKESD